MEKVWVISKNNYKNNFKQIDVEWKDIVMKKDTLGKSGCLVTTIANILNKTPKEVLQDAIEKNCLSNNDILDASKYLKSHKYKVEDLPIISIESIKNQLNSNNHLIGKVSLNQGPHFVNIIGIDVNSGDLKVLDPGYINTIITYNIKDLKQVKIVTQDKNVKSNDFKGKGGINKVMKDIKKNECKTNLLNSESFKNSVIYGNIAGDALYDTLNNEKSGKQIVKETLIKGTISGVVSKVPILSNITTTIGAVTILSDITDKICDKNLSKIDTTKEISKTLIKTSVKIGSNYGSLALGAEVGASFGVAGGPIGIGIGIGVGVIAGFFSSLITDKLLN